MKKYKLTIAYDGTHYCGWQVQPNGISIQSVLEKSLSCLLKDSITIIGAGRTDAGVHALGQVAHFETDQELSFDRILMSLNGILPSDIRIKELTPISKDFHARYSALGKEYHYHLWLEKTIDPFFHLYRHHPRFLVSLPLLQEAASAFVGTHDFSTFANVGGAAKTAIRTIQRIDMVPQEGGVRLEFEGNGFLYKMVRNIVGTLLEVASGKRPFESLKTLFEAKDRRLAGIAAPAKGLFLVKVRYPSIFS